MCRRHIHTLPRRLRISTAGVLQARTIAGLAAAVYPQHNLLARAKPPQTTKTKPNNKTKAFYTICQTKQGGYKGSIDRLAGRRPAFQNSTKQSCSRVGGAIIKRKKNGLAHRPRLTHEAYHVAGRNTPILTFKSKSKLFHTPSLPLPRATKIRINSQPNLDNASFTAEQSCTLRVYIHAGRSPRACRSQRTGRKRLAKPECRNSRRNSRRRGHTQAKTKHTAPTETTAGFFLSPFSAREKRAMNNSSAGGGSCALGEPKHKNNKEAAVAAAAAAALRWRRWRRLRRLRCNAVCSPRSATGLKRTKG